MYKAKYREYCYYMAQGLKSPVSYEEWLAMKEWLEKGIPNEPRILGKSPAIKRWSCHINDFVENERVDAFIERVIALSQQYGLSISHEDGQGAFLIRKQDDFYNKWLRNAHIEGEI